MMKKNVAAPLFEEWIFRNLMTSVLQSLDFDNAQIILYTSILFSLSHAHNFFRLKKKLKSNIKIAVLSTAFQMSFTFIFGLYCSHNILKTNSIYSAIILHAMCNIYGFPSVGEVFTSKFSDNQKIVVITGYISGVVLFFVYLNTPFLIDS